MGPEGSVVRNGASNRKEGGRTGCREWVDKARGWGVEVEAGPNEGTLECCSCWILGGQTGRTGWGISCSAMDREHALSVSSIQSCALSPSMGQENRLEKGCEFLRSNV